jgi:hypothetical protein
LQAPASTARPLAIVVAPHGALTASQDPVCQARLLRRAWDQRRLENVREFPCLSRGAHEKLNSEKKGFQTLRSSFGSGKSGDQSAKNIIHVVDNTRRGLLVDMMMMMMLMMMLA